MLTKVGRFEWADIYRAPIALLLWPVVSINYRLRSKRMIKDRWFWADALLCRWGYFV
jgi:hypothetical protein